VCTTNNEGHEDWKKKKPKTRLLGRQCPKKARWKAGWKYEKDRRKRQIKNLRRERNRMVLNNRGVKGNTTNVFIPCKRP